MSTSATTPPTGPATPEGRAVSARNATTHGLFARDVVLPMLGEDPAAYEALLQQLITELPPRNLLERHYLEQIAAASWRLRRLHPLAGPGLRGRHTGRGRAPGPARQDPAARNDTHPPD